MDHLPVNNNVKFAKLLSTNTRFASFSLLAAIAVASAGLIIISGLFFGRAQIFAPQKSVGTPEPRSDALRERETESLRREESLLRGLPFQQALESMQAQLVQVVSPTKLGKSGILTITDSGILKPTDHNITQGGIGTDVSRIGKIWGTFMDLNDDVSINGKLDLAGKLTANGNVTLGNNDGDEIEIGGRFTSNLVPKKTNDIDIGTTGLRFRTGYFVNSLVIGSGTTTITTSGITTTGGSSTTITSSLLNLVSTGNLQLDTSTNNDNILLLTGTGNVGIGSTAPVYKLDVNGTLRTTGTANITGDLTLDGDLDFTGAQNITTTSDNLTISPTGNLIIDTSGGTVSIRDAAIDLTNQPTTISGSTLTLRSTGTFILDTSANNTNIALQAGTGTLNISATTARLTGNLIVTGTETFNGIAYTFPGTQTASGVLTTDGAGILSWGTIGAANITADSLDFAQFDDSLDLDANTSINGPYSFVIRAGQGSIENSTSGNNDLQLAAADKLILAGASFDLSTSSGGVDIISAGRIDLSGRGTLTLDTSQSNANIVLTPGTGNIGIGSTAPIYKLDVNGTLRTTSTARIEGALTVTTGGASVTGDLSLDGDLDFTGSQNITTTADNLTISPNGNLIVDTSGGTVSIRDAAIDLTNQPTTISGSSLTLRATGNFILDTSANNTNLVLQGGTGGLTGSFGTANLTAITDSVSAVYLNSQRGGITLSSSNASGNGPIRILSGGSLQLSTSQGNQPIYLQAGTGNLNVSSNQLYLTGNLVVTGTETFNGIAYTFPGADTANGVLLTDGSGVLSWTTGLTGASLADDTLDFVDLQDELDLDADTSVNGDYSLIIRSGLGSIQNSTSGSNDLQLSAEDKLVFDAASLTLTTSNGPIDILSRGYLDLSSTGTLTLDTSQNNTNILLKAGSGSINLSSGTTTISGNVNLNSGTLTLNGVTYTFPGADGSASNALTTNGSGLLSWGTLGAASITNDSLDFAQFDDALDLDADTSINGPYSFIVRAGNAARQNATAGNNDLQLSAEDAMILDAGDIAITVSEDSTYPLIFRASAGGIQLSTQSADNGNLTLYSAGTLTLDSSRNNTNVLILPGTGNVGIGSTAPAYKLDISGTLRTTSTARVEGALTVTAGGAAVTGDLTLDGDLDFTGPQNITTTADDLTLSPTGNLRIDTTGGTVKVSDTLEIGDGGVTNYASFSTTGDLTLAGAANNLIANNDLVIRAANSLTIDTSANNTNINLRAGTGGLTGSFGTVNLTAVTDSVSAVYLNSQRGGITLSSSNASGNGPVKILSGGSLQLSTSQGNQPIYLQAGTGNVNVSSNQLYLTGNLVVTGTETFNGVTYTFPGADGSSGQALTTNSSGVLSWTTTAAADDSLDFAKFEDSLDMDTDTLVNGDYSLVLRAGAGGLQNSTSGSNDLQLAAEDKLIFDAASLTLTTSNGPVDILSRGYLDLSSTGTLTLDTSQNNTNILLKAGTGSINLSSGTTTISGNVNLNSGSLTLNGVAYTWPGADGSSGQALSTNASGILSWSTIGVSADSLDFTDFKDTLTMDSDTQVNGDYSFILRAGLGAIQNSTSGSNDIQLAAEDRMDLYAGSYSLTTSGNSVDILSGGRIDLSAKGTLTLDTSQNNSQILIRAGTGRVDVSGNTILVNAGTGTLTLSSSGGITIGGEGATTRVSGDLNFTGRLLEDGNEVLGNMIAPFAAACPTGWSEYTNARGRVIVGNVSGGTLETTVGTALTGGGTRTITDVPAHTHAVDPASTSVSITDPGHTHNVRGDVSAAAGSARTQNYSGDVNTNPTTSSTTGITAAVDIASFTSGSTGVASVDVTMPYIQLTYCQKTAGADYAEWTRSREQYQPGTVVSADPQAAEQIKITEKPYDSAMLGIISTAPGWTVGQETPDSLQLALNGRVPVKIDPDSEPIKIGDFLTSSAKPGLAMKATKMGYTVGKALENWSCEGSDPSVHVDGSDPSKNSCKQSIMVFVNLGTYLGPLTADGYIDTGANFIAGDVKVDLRAETYRRLMSELNLPTTEPEPQKVGPFVASALSPSSPAEPDPAPQDADTVSASVAEVLSALAGKLDKADQRISTLEAGGLTLSGSYMNSELTLTGSNGELRMTNDELATAFSIQNSVFSILSSATIGGDLTVGLLTIDDLDASINSMGETLRLQNLGLANVEIMAGKVVIDTKGNLVLKSGDLILESGKIAGNSSFRGSVIMPASPAGGPAGQGSLRIDTSWDTVPVTVNLTPTWNTAVWVEDLGKTGFTLRVSTTPSADSKLFWLAIW